MEGSMNKLSYSIGSTSINVEIPDGFPLAFVRDEQGFLDADDIEGLIECLSNTLTKMNGGLDQSEILADCEQAVNETDLLAPYWTFPDRRMAFGYIGQCLYFVYSPRLNEIKIGHATNLTQRLWGIARDANEKRDALRVVAILKCDHPRRLEAYVHDRMRAARLHGEWFKPEAALQFIYECSGVRTEVR
jgi:hypothetical protein